MCPARSVKLVAASRLTIPRSLAVVPAGGKQIFTRSRSVWWLKQVPEDIDAPAGGLPSKRGITCEFFYPGTGGGWIGIRIPDPGAGFSGGVTRYTMSLPVAAVDLRKT